MKKLKKRISQRNRESQEAPSSLEVISRYAAALAERDGKQMHTLRSSDFVLDFVHGDAFHNEPLSAEAIQDFWPAWFAGFPDMDFEITRTIAAESVVVLQWTFTGHNTGSLEPPVFGRYIEATGRTIRLRGVSIYDVNEGCIHRETLYIDFATLWVELGIEV